MASFKMRCEVCGKECESGYVLDAHMRHDHDGIGHIHKYTVPVEWKEKANGHDGYGYTKKIDKSYPVVTAVTRLRCESCPDEISREDK